MTSTNPSYKIRFRRFVRELSRRYNDSSFTPILRKRTYFESLGWNEFEFERYGQRIDNDFFRENTGHGVIG